MIGIRSRIIVKAELDKLGIRYGRVHLGEAELQENITADQHEKLKSALILSGLKLIDDKKNILIKKTKEAIIEVILYAEERSHQNLSDYLSEKLNYD